MPLFYICNQHEIKIKLKALTKTEKSVCVWKKHYVDKQNSEEWLLSEYDSEYLRDRISVLKKLLQPSPDELIDIAPTSQHIP